MKKYISVLIQIMIIFIITSLGNWLAQFLPIKVPGSIVGMLILLIMLFSGLMKLSVIKEGADFLLKYMAFFFIPAAVGIIKYTEFIRLWWLPWLTIVIVTNVVVLGGTAKLLDILYTKAGEK